MTDIIKGIPHKLIEVVLGNTAPLASNLDPPSHILGLNLCSLEGSVGNIEVYNEIKVLITSSLDLHKPVLKGIERGHCGTEKRKRWGVYGKVIASGHDKGCRIKPRHGGNN